MVGEDGPPKEHWLKVMEFSWKLISHKNDGVAGKMLNVEMKKRRCQ